MKKIIFVCLGNICRSPMAEYVFKALIKERGLERDFTVQSRATSYEEVGNPIYYRAKEELDAHGVPCGAHRARRLSKEECLEADYLVCMDDGNVRAAKAVAGSAACDKIVKLASFYGSDSDIADPWYTRRFDLAYEQIRRGCEGLLAALADAND